MSDKPEPLADVLAEMRDFADHRAADAGGERPAIELLRSFADRIEAAAERERTPPSDGRDPDKATVHIPHETTGEILAEMRRGIRCGRGYDIDDVNRFVRDWAARIQIATERDLEACRAYTPESVYAMLEEFHNAHYSVFPRDELTERLCHAFHDQFAKADSTTPGNAAAMRAALENARSKFIHIKKCADEGEVSRKKLAILCEFVSQEISAALAAPARNCDRPECADVESAWATYCAETNRADCKGFARWLFAPAEGGAK
jgi:hypothetical protein